MSNALDQLLLRELVRQQEAMGWPDMVPRNAEIKLNVFKPHGMLTVGDCEQIVEWRSRLARIALKKLRAEPTSLRYLQRAAKHILYARLYRCQYLTLIGKKDSTEADMPFPIVSVE